MFFLSGCVCATFLTLNDTCFDVFYLTQCNDIFKMETIL